VKLSASIYSQKELPLELAVHELQVQGADYLHLDCNDRLEVFDDVPVIRKYFHSSLDLHLITPYPATYWNFIRRSPVEFVTLQYEVLERFEPFPSDLNCRRGIAIMSDTPVEVLEPYRSYFDFILLMATVPGRSGGKFNKENFGKIRRARELFGDKRIHVDGGVNAEVAFVLRSLGVDVAVTGSYLYGGGSLGAAMLHLKSGDRLTSQECRVCDFMLTGGELPILNRRVLSFRGVLEMLEAYRLGFVLVVDDGGVLEGIVSQADMRRAMLGHFEYLPMVPAEAMLNRKPLVARDDWSVAQMIDFVKRQRMPINFLPVTDGTGVLVGALVFHNLIKGEG
jgi:ribulose-phosphate 3-epimerase